MALATDRVTVPGTLRIAAAIAGAALLAASTFAQMRPRLENPHGRFREECSLCHGADSWKVAKIGPKFDHARYGFRLEGAHASANCMACHPSLEFAQARTQCVSCHEDPHRGEMGVDCARCHGARSFTDRGPMVRAHQLTRFPLTGGHAGLDCESCHVPAAQGHLQFVATKADCQGCHMPQYQSAKNPDHVTGHYPTDCAACHSPTTWSGARFDHDATAFPLTGAHRALECAACHGDGVYAGKSTACVACHATDYNTAQPPHAPAGFAASACASCHNTTTFASGGFNHNSTPFPLTGAHVATPCSSCHGDGVYAGKPTECQSCHLTDYNNASPNHAASGFAASACAGCHNTTQWAGATFDHDGPWFPIYSGRHAGTWASCATCHTNAANYAVFTCLSCHPHDNQATTNAQHSGRSGYSYDSNACYRCHPNGRAG